MADHYSDRSRTETDNSCERKLYWGYYAGGRGLTPVGGKFDLEFGKAIHAHVEGVPETEHSLTAVGETLDTVETPDGWNAFHEAAALYDGLTKTYTRFLQPQLEAEYDVVGSEVEMTMELAPGIFWMSRLDGILRRKADGLYFVLECKTTSYPDDLMKQSRTNFQLLMECEALRRWLAERHFLKHGLDSYLDKAPPPFPQVGGAVLLVFNKGTRREATKWEQEHGRSGYRRLSPFTYVYGKSLADGSMEYQLDYTSKKGFECIPTWTIPGWYDILLANWPQVAKLQVQLWPSVDFDEVRTASVIRQIVSRERRLAHYKAQAAALPVDSSQQEVLVDANFSQNFGNCLNDGGYRKQCPFYSCCFSPNVARDPLSNGYEERVPNHPIEGSGQ